MPDSPQIQHFRTFVNIPYYEGIDNSLLGKKGDAPARLEAFYNPNKDEEAIVNLIVNQQGQSSVLESVAMDYLDRAIHGISLKLMGVKMDEKTKISYNYVENGVGDLSACLKSTLRLHSERIMPSGNIKTYLAFQKENESREIIGVVAPTFSEGFHYLNSLHISLKVIERALLGIDIVKVAKQHGLTDRLFNEF